MHPAIAAIKTAFIKKGDDLSFSFPMVIKTKEIAGREKTGYLFFSLCLRQLRGKKSPLRLYDSVYLIYQYNENDFEFVPALLLNQDGPAVIVMVTAPAALAIVPVNSPTTTWLAVGV